MEHGKENTTEPIKQHSPTNTTRQSVDVHNIELTYIATAGYGQNGDKPKQLHVQSKRINLLSSTIDLFSELITKFQLIQLCRFCGAVISQ